MSNTSSGGIKVDVKESKNGVAQSLPSEETQTAMAVGNSSENQDEIGNERWFFFPNSIGSVAYPLFHSYIFMTAWFTTIALVIDTPLMHGLTVLVEEFFGCWAALNLVTRELLGSAKPPPAELAMASKLLPKLIPGPVVMAGLLAIPVIYLGVMIGVAPLGGAVPAIVEGALKQKGFITDEAANKAKGLSGLFNLPSVGGILFVAFYPMLASAVPAVLAGLILPAGFSILTFIPEAIMKVTFEKLEPSLKKQFFSGLVGQNVLKIFAFVEVLRTGCMLASAVDNPGMIVWMTALLTSFVQALLTRTGWVQFLLWKFTNKTSMLPGMTFHFGNHCKYGLSYIKAVTMATLLTIRLVVGTHPFAFNSNFTMLCLGIVVEMVLEDLLVYGMRKAGMKPKFDDAAALTFYSSIDTATRGYLKGYSSSGEELMHFEKDVTPMDMILVNLQNYCAAATAGMLSFCISIGFRKVLVGGPREEWWDVLFHWPPRDH